MPVCAERDTAVRCLLILSMSMDVTITRLRLGMSLPHKVSYFRVRHRVEPTSPSPIAVFTTIGLGGPIAEGQNFQANLFAESVIISPLGCYRISKFGGDHPGHSRLQAASCR